MTDLRQERELTYFLVSHDLSVIAHMCDQIMVMSQGKIVERLEQEALRNRTAKSPYIIALMEASRGFTRQVPTT